MEWKEVTLGEITNLVIDYRGKTPLKLGSSWSDSGHRALSAKNIKTGQIVAEDSIRFVDEELYRKWMKDEVKKGDILITSEAPFGQIYYWDSDEKIVLSQRLFDVRLNDEVCHKYVYYFMTSHRYQKDLEGRATGTTVTGLRQPELLKSTILLPPLSAQRSISSILSSLDRKIELNNKINADLEEMAQAIFKNWFVDFEPFKDGKFVDSELGMIPEGWKVGRLTEIASYMNGLAMQKFPPENDEDSLPVLKIKELGQGFCGPDSDRCSCNIKDECKVHNGDVIFSWSGTLLVDVWCGGDCGLNQHLFKVTSKEYPKWFYYYWTKHHLQEFIHIAKDKAVTMGHIKRGHLEEALVAIPDNDSMERAHELFEPILSKMISLRLENSRLSLLRDTLLPRLMSGELEVPE